MANLGRLLSEPFAWMQAEQDANLKTFLSDLQANILKGHGRFNTAHMFLSFEGMPPDEVAALVRSIGRYCTSAYDQLRKNRKYPPYLDGGPVRCFFLAAGGYRALGAGVTMPADPAFQAGMAARGNILGDPPQHAWQATGWRDRAPDAMLLLADASADGVTRDLEAAEGWLNGTGARLLVVERGLQQTRSFRPGKTEGVEHFGYVDGRSQPLMLLEDIAAEGIPQDPPGTPPAQKHHWDPAFPPKQFILADPNGRSPLSAGSYFVFRKLEQNVRGFNAAEDALAKQLFGASPTDDESDRAGAMVVGRFEDGTPLTLDDHESKQAVTNDFSYAGDANGARCPFHAHIRKTNPRGDIERTFGAPENAGRDPIMARRGITYGVRRKTPDGSDFADGGQEPERDVGLLFMAYMASLEKQFEFTQQSWANAPGFVATEVGTEKRPTGIDPVIGQSRNADDHRHVFRDGWTDGPEKTLGFKQFVTMQGGEYFFAPSLSFLRSVGR